MSAKISPYELRKCIFWFGLNPVVITLLMVLAVTNGLAVTVINGVTIGDGSFQIVSDEFLGDGTFNATRQTTNGVFLPTVYTNDVSIVSLDVGDAIGYNTLGDGQINESFVLAGGIAPRLQELTQISLGGGNNWSSQVMPRCSIQYYFLPVAKPGAPNVTSVPVQIIISGQVNLSCNGEVNGIGQAFVGLPYGFVPESYAYTIAGATAPPTIFVFNQTTNFTINQIGNVPLNAESSIVFSANVQFNLDGVFGFAGGGSQIIIDPTIIVDPNWAYANNFTVIQSQNLFAAPRLQASLQGPNIVLSWPAAIYGYSLEYSSNIGSLAVWDSVTNPPVEINGQNTVTNVITGTQMFFRLSQ
jgi:hypothetical protein